MATYTFDIFSTLDGHSLYDAPGYWGKHGPEFLDHRLKVYGGKQRMIFRANTFREFMQMMSVTDTESGVHDA